MKKIILILNESHIPQRVIERAVFIAKESNSILEAIFIEDISTMDFGYPFPNDMYLANDNSLAEPDTGEVTPLMLGIAQQFRDECENKGIEFKIEIEKSVSVSHLITLSRFADLIIADSKSDSDGYSLQDLLVDAACPLLLVSPNAEPPQKIFLAYDGNISIMYAIKMFSYVFPEFSNLPTQLFTIVTGNVTRIPHLEEIKSWAAKHFAQFEIEMIIGNTRKQMVEHLRKDSEKCIVVMGAYSGSSMGRLFLKSTAESVINETNASLFITHE